MKNTILPINVIIVVIFAIEGYVAFSGMKTDNTSLFVAFALLAVVHGFKEISKRLDKIEATIKSSESDEIPDEPAADKSETPNT